MLLVYNLWQYEDGFQDMLQSVFQKREVRRWQQPLVIDHVDRNIRTRLPADVPVHLRLDGHSFRNGFVWLERAIKCNIEIIITSQNASHFLQLNDQAVNHVFKSAFCHLRTELSKWGMVDFRDVRMKLVLTVAVENENKILILCVRMLILEFGQWTSVLWILTNSSETNVVLFQLLKMIQNQNVT